MEEVKYFLVITSWNLKLGALIVLFVKQSSLLTKLLLKFMIYMFFRVKYIMAFWKSVLKSFLNIHLVINSESEKQSQLAGLVDFEVTQWDFCL